VTLRKAEFGSVARPVAELSRYDDDPVRWGVIATLFWGVAGFAAGLYIALQLAFPALNLGLEYTSFGRLRPLHTSAVIFAFGGNALIATAARTWQHPRSPSATGACRTQPPCAT
jgi:cytochrome c oxidase cbb3-type subunit 1